MQPSQFYNTCLPNPLYLMKHWRRHDAKNIKLIFPFFVTDNNFSKINTHETAFWHGGLIYCILAVKLWINLLLQFRHVPCTRFINCFFEWIIVDEQWILCCIIYHSHSVTLAIIQSIRLAIGFKGQHFNSTRVINGYSCLIDFQKWFQLTCWVSVEEWICYSLKHWS